MTIPTRAWGVLSAITRPLTRRVPISGAAIVLLAASAVLGNVGQYIDRDRAQTQIATLQAASDRADDVAACQNRLTGYIAALSLTESAYGWAALISAYQGDDIDPAAARKVIESSNALIPLLPLRDRVVEICDADPDFDPSTDIKE